MGDSWGDEWGSGSMQGAKPSESLSHTLATEFDCAVINLCRGGIGNGMALDILKRAIIMCVLEWIILIKIVVIT